MAWGYNGQGQTNVPAPNTGFIAVAGGGFHSLGLKADGSIVAWSWNLFGQTNVPAPNTGFIALAAGRSHSLGLKADGSIVAWGYNIDGQTNIPAPNTRFIALAGGGHHNLGIQAPPPIVGDVDGDRDVDGIDYNRCAVCLSGPAETERPALCTAQEFASCDLNSNGHADLVDIADLSIRFARP